MRFFWITLLQRFDRRKQPGGRSLAASPRDLPADIANRNSLWPR